jgi:hypothetical protein
MPAGRYWYRTSAQLIVPVADASSDTNGTNTGDCNRVKSDMPRVLHRYPLELTSS